MTGQTITELSHMGSLTTAVTALLAEAAGLPDPTSMTIFGIINGHVHDAVTLHFAPVEASTEAIALWAIRFGGVIGSWTDDLNGVPTRWVRTKFTCQGSLKSTRSRPSRFRSRKPSPTAEQDSEPVAATPF